MRSLGLDQLRAVREISRAAETTLATGDDLLDRVAFQFDAALDDAYGLLRGVALPGSATTIDMVLVGPPGIWALYVESDPGQFKADGEEFYAWDSQAAGYLPAQPNPLPYLLDNQAQLRGWLRTARLPRDCARSAILFTEGVAVGSSNSPVALVDADRLSAFPAEVASGPAVLDGAAVERALVAIAHGELPPPPRRRVKSARPIASRLPVLLPWQWAVLGSLALLNLCVLGGACALILYLAR